MTIALQAFFLVAIALYPSKGQSLFFISPSIDAIKLSYCLPSIAMQLTRELLKQDIDRLNSQQLVEVADFIAFLQFRDRVARSIDPNQFAALAEFADDDRSLAEAGMSDYAILLAHEDES